MGDALLDAASVLGLPGGSAPLRMPELGPGARPRLHLAPRESAGVHFEWRGSGAGGASPRGSLVVSGYVSAAAEKRAKAAGARPGAALLSVNGVILGDRDKGFIMQRMSSTLGVARQLGFGDFTEAEPAPALRHSTSQQTLKTAPASPLAPKPASASSAPRASNAGRYASYQPPPVARPPVARQPNPYAAPSFEARRQNPYAATSFETRGAYPAPPRSFEGHAARPPAAAPKRALVAPADPYSTSSRRRRITHEFAARAVWPLLRDAAYRATVRWTRGRAAVAWQRRARGAAARRAAARRRRRRDAAAATRTQAWARRYLARAARYARAVAAAQRAARAWLAAAEAWRRRRALLRRWLGAVGDAQRLWRGAAARARAARVRRLREAMRRCLGLLSFGARFVALRRWRDETRRALALQRAARRWRAFLLDRAAFRAMVRRAALAAEVLRRSAAQRRRRRAWDAWRTAYAEELRSDRIKAALAARAAAELLARLAALKAMEVSEDEGVDAPSSEDTESVEEEEAAWTPPDRTCVRCGHRGPGEGFALSDDVCLACFGEEAARLARMREAEARRARAQLRLQAWWRRVLCEVAFRRRLAARRRWREEERRWRAATVVAAAARARREASRFRAQRRAAARIQAPWRGKLGRDAFERMLDEAMVEITKIADASFAELADWPPKPERLPNGDWKRPAWMEDIRDDTEDVYEQLLLLALKKPPPPPKPPPEPDDPVYDGEDEAACAFLKFMLKQTPPPPYCMEDPKAHLRNLAKNLPRRKLDLGQPPEPPIEWDYAPGDPRRDESYEAEAKRRAPPPPPPPTKVDLFLEQWYKDHPECPRIDFDFKDDWADPKFGR